MVYSVLRYIEYSLVLQRLFALQRTAREIPVAPLSVVLAISLAPIGSAGIIHDETVNGDLSSDQNSPTNLGTLFAGSHNVKGTSTGTTDRDFWTITIPANHLLTSIIIDGLTSTDNQGFFAIRNGTSFPSLTDATQLFGRTLIGGAAGRNPGDDILDNLSQNNSPSPGLGTPSNFTPPLGQGTYSFWIQENAGSIIYDLRFNVVPEPSSLLLASSVLGYLSRRRVR